MKTKKKVKKLIRKDWVNVGGGCETSTKKKFPCDDIYQNKKTGSSFVIYSTKETHFKMPAKAESKASLLKIKGTSSTQK